MAIKAVKLVNGDIHRETGRAVYVEGVDAEKQALENGIHLVLGEWFLEPTKGLEWFSIFEIPYSRSLFELQLRDYLNAHERVESIESIDVSALDRKTRAIEAFFEVTTISGNLTGEVVI